MIHDGHRLRLCTIVAYEWLRGPRTRADLTTLEELLPRDTWVAFGPVEADVAARLYGAVRRPRGREVDLAIAATALVDDAALWTLTPDDFDDSPDLRLV